MSDPLEEPRMVAVDPWVLASDLMAWARTLDNVALVVAYEDHDELVVAQQYPALADAVKAITGHVTRGGLPLGVIGFTGMSGDPGGNFVAEPLGELRDAVGINVEAVRQRLLTLLDRELNPDDSN
jgi:hypothetical protein